MPVIHSLAELRGFLPSFGPRVREWSPVIPCSRCGVWVIYNEAIRSDIGPGHVGFTHGGDLCKADDVAEKARRDLTANRGHKHW